MAKEAKKGQQKIRKLLKKVKHFEVTKKRSRKYFSKAGTINLAQFLVHEFGANLCKLGAVMR